MTMDDQVIVDVTDIQTIHCECRHCHTTITYPLERWNPDEMKCPGCDLAWWTANNPGLKDIQEFAKLWRAVVERQQRPEDVNARVRVRFQLARPKP